MNAIRNVTAKNVPSRLLIILVITSVVVGVLYWVSYPAYAIRTRSERDFSAAKESLNPEELRRWSLDMVARYSPTKSSTEEIPRHEVPKEIRGIFRIPPYVIVSDRNPPIVQLRFGGGFGHWFIAIGPTNFSWSSGGAFRSKEWVPGIYFVVER